MSIKFRLILSNLLMILIPVILFFFSSVLLMIVFIGDFREVSQFLPESHQYDKSIQPDTSLFMELKRQSAMNEDVFMSKDYLDSMDDQLQLIDAALMIRKNDDIYYSSQQLQTIDTNEMPPFGTETNFRNLELVGNQTFAIKQHDFYLSDGEAVSLFLMKNAAPLNHFVKTLFPILIGICLLILIITNGLLTYFVSRSIIKPIQQLKTAAGFIKNGDLQHSILPVRNDEIGQLTQTFEEMRIQLHQSEQIQTQYENNRKELIAHISHDLKTPITSIKGYIEGILDGVADSPEKRHHYIQTIYRKALDIDHLIDDLFLFSKLDLRKLPFQFEEIDLKSYLEDYIEELSFDLRKSNVEVDFHYQPTASYFVRVDRDKFKRVLANIIENSLKYMDKEQKHLRLTLTMNDSLLSLAIEDNGPGIPQESIPHIFDQFYRADKSRNKLTGGTGLGLAIAKMIIEEHHGTIQVDSTLQVGTTMTVTLPQTTEEEGN